MLKKKYLHKHYIVTLQTSMGDILIKSENCFREWAQYKLYSSNDTLNFFLNKDLVFVCFINRDYYPCKELQFQYLIAGTSGKCIFKLSTGRLDGLSSDIFLFPHPSSSDRGRSWYVLNTVQKHGKLGTSTSENYAVKELTLGKHSRMGWNTVFKLEYYDASQAYQYKYSLADFSLFHRAF